MASVTAMPRLSQPVTPPITRTSRKTRATAKLRGFTQDDAHIFCTPEQIEDEVVGCIDFALAVLKTYGFDQYQVELSTWDPKDRKTYAGDDAQWELAQRSLEQALKRRNIEYKLIPGEAAFYGPKIDIKLVDAIGRLWQLSTVQFDFTLPERFGLEYVGEDGKRHQPLMVHRALYGSVERFFGVLIEHYARGISRVAVAGAGGRGADRREAPRVRQRSRRQTEGCRRSRAG